MSYAKARYRRRRRRWRAWWKMAHRLRAEGYTLHVVGRQQLWTRVTIGPAQILFLGEKTI